MREDMKSEGDGEEEQSENGGTATGRIIAKLQKLEKDEKTLRKVIRCFAPVIGRTAEWLEIRVRRAATEEDTRRIEAEITREKAEARQQALRLLPPTTIADAESRQRNLEDIVAEATRLLWEGQGEQRNEETQEPEKAWREEFQRHAGASSTDWVKHSYARILAGEIGQQGKFSRRTVAIVGTMDQRVAELFRTATSLAIHYQYEGKDRVSGERIGKAIIAYPRLLEIGEGLENNALGDYDLDLLGLMELEGAGLLVARTVERCAVRLESQGGDILAPFMHQGRWYQATHKDGATDEESLNVRGMTFTRQGKELTEITEFVPYPKYTARLSEHLAKRKLTLMAAKPQEIATNRDEIREKF